MLKVRGNMGHRGVYGRVILTREDIIIIIIIIINMINFIWHLRGELWARVSMVKDVLIKKCE